MKIPSLIFLYQHAAKSFKRFPLTIVMALVAATLSIYLIEVEELKNKLPFINIILASSIGIPLYFCTSIVSEKRSLVRKHIIGLQIIATLVLVLIYFSLPNEESTHNTSLPYIKYGIYNATCHLLVSFIPFIFTRQLNGFWNYNKILFIRFLTSLLYSGFIYVGLIIALSALNLLFDIKIHSELYGDLWVVCALFFNTWFFVAGIPDNFEQLDSNVEYPKGLKIFSQYILLPLLGLYLIILYAYGTKIILLWDWPKGIVSYLIVCVSVLGIFAYLLLYPYGKQEGNQWIQKSYKWYYALLIPLLVILFIAIFLRVMDYGITINRYVIIALGAWLCIVCIYTLLGKSNIKFIPTSLAIIMMLTSFGPWGMFTVSENNQIERLKLILSTAKILKESKVSAEPIYGIDKSHNLISPAHLSNENSLNDSLHNEVKSILEYLDDHHGFEAIRPWYSQDIDSLITALEKHSENKYRYSEAEVYMNALGLDYKFRDSTISDNKFSFSINDESNNVKLTKDYDYLISFDKYIYSNRTDDNSFVIKEFMIDSVSYVIQLTNDSTLALLRKESIIASVSLSEFTKPLVEKYGNTSNYKVPATELHFMTSSEYGKIKIAFSSIEFEVEKDKHKITEITGDLLLKIE